MNTEPTRDEPPRILVVDDNIDAADSIGELLKLLGADVQVRHAAPAALSALDDFSADLVLLDVAMPEMNGDELARTIRARLGERAPMLIALTGSCLGDDEIAGTFDRAFVKPIGIESLQALLDELGPGHDERRQR
ncbi:MAG: response regulator [Lautropia sp.]